MQNRDSVSDGEQAVTGLAGKVEGAAPSLTPVHAASSGSTKAAQPDVDVLTGTLGYALKRAQVRSYEMFFSVVGADAISPGRMTALSLIGMEPGVTQSALAERLAISRAAMVKVIDALESRGFIERRAAEGDRRSYALNLTPEGHQELNVLTHQIRAYEERLAANLSSDERAQLIALLEKVGL
ncbi:MarR family transcriptional regulator [Pseudomonas sp. BN605]|uniref:MarR family transcriptional regulator n=1 Tax=Pseudomonas hunanensis TaxID=1247546 RepID=A0ABD6MXB4_9PSED|nr:MarR family transcriptional regulator [Pseudomonas sp. BN605]MDH4847940.1 MarR family transcriptional regulator [Pseudomonas sp. BN605]NWL45631.1 MarR family transcriptional regulator [Pseudomonas hunanensis]